MSVRIYLELDVFPASRGGGNPLGVVHGAADWSTETMQRFAAWTNLVETTFLLPPRAQNASYRVRIFTPKREIAFAGHPSIGSAHAALELGLIGAGDALSQECDAGVLPLRIEGSGENRRIFVQAPRARILKRGLDAEPGLAAVLRGLTLGDLAPAFVEGGRRWWVAEIADEAALRGWHPDHAAIAALAHATDSLGLTLFARSRSQDHELVVRAFPAGVGIAEDPASGAANGLIAAYLAEYGQADQRSFRVSQGREIGHDAAIHLHIADDGEVWVGGRTEMIVRGDLFWD
ncbi:MAG TPA: PhzF family phenazine biosynthesis protein [Xanthomonadaceae bacterium]|nr:PhzF family phenazine biosynthesis protein [Xanthomonadaceae bacterium]